MTAVTLQIAITTLSCLFAGIVLFLASVLKQAFAKLTSLGRIHNVSRGAEPS